MAKAMLLVYMCWLAQKTIFNKSNLNVFVVQCWIYVFQILNFIKMLFPNNSDGHFNLTYSHTVRLVYSIRHDDALWLDKTT